MYYIVETNHRPDGVINISTTARQTFASALSFYHDRYSKMVMSEDFTSVAIQMVDENLDVWEHDVIETQYKPAE